MPTKQVFLSYSSQDRLLASSLVHALEGRGWSVWWDRADIPPGERFSRVIAEAIRAARVIVVLWSRKSVDSDWVLDEADDGKKRGILVPVLVDEVEIPRGFRQYQHLRLIGWQGAADDSELQRLFEAVRRLAPPEAGSLIEPAPGGRALPPRLGAVRGPGGQGPVVEPPAVNRPINLGFDGPVVGGLPDGWFNGFGQVSGVSLSYQCCVVSRPEANGACLLVQRANAHEAEFGSVMQRCPARALAGRTVRFEGELRSQGVSRWAGLWLRADGEQQGNLYFDNMHRRPLRGTTPWAVYQIDAQLPTATWWLNYGVVLSGDGQVWVDNCRLLVWHEDGTWREW